MWPPQERSGLGPAIRSCIIAPHQVEKAPLSAVSLRLLLILGSLGIITPPGPREAGVGGGHGHHATVHTWLGLPSGSDHLPCFASEPPPGKQPHWRPFQKGTELWAAPSLPAGRAWDVQDMSVSVSVQPGGSVALARPRAVLSWVEVWANALVPMLQARWPQHGPVGFLGRARGQQDSSDCCWDPIGFSPGLEIQGGVEQGCGGGPWVAFPRHFPMTPL
ncbi:hypothetical protein P7K49_040147 [Saguinus oedipus]|uniref:Uncharacterized protein n=1 Tax=Saguinus oedipus TaxID=9490 RepID=A0ABQ9T8G1_SAGOE|nr:hypothetical protein P7K49_040147 [Saguinus oedipus]